MLVIDFRHLPLSKHHARDDTKYSGKRPDKSFKFRGHVTEEELFYLYLLILNILKNMPLVYKKGSRTVRHHVK